jgi:hypothetical protein
MFAFLKGLVAGAILAFVVAGLIGHAGGTGGILHVFGFVVHGYRLHWSWGLFVGGTFLGWAIFTMLE